MRYATFLIAAIALLVVISLGERAQAAFPGTNGRIAFSMVEGRNNHIWTMSPGGSNRTRLTNVSGRDDFAPVWSADGNRIVYASRKNGATTLRIREANGPSDDGVAGTMGAFSPAWLPNGSGLVFAKDTSGSISDLFTIDLTSKQVTNITNTPTVDEESPRVSPDGAKVAFTTVTAPATTSDIWVMTIGGNATPLANTPDADESSPSWSPDGSKVIFNRWMGDTNKNDIFEIAPNGGNELPLVTGTSDDRDAAYSPDGTKIVFERLLIPQANALPQGGPGYKYHIMVAGSDGIDPTDISPVAATSDFTPDWGVDIPGRTLTWGDNNCSGAHGPLDALETLLHESTLGQAPAGCLAIGETVHTASFGDRMWGDLDCSELSTPQMCCSC